MKKLCVIILVILFNLSYSFSQTPQSINYQAIVRNITGDPIINSTVSIKIAIIAENPTGTAVYAETHSLETNQYGLINLKIGKGVVVDGIFSEIEWGGNEHYIQIAIDVEGGDDYEVMGVSQILSVPYALYAKRAATVDNVDGVWTENEEGIYYTGNVGIGTSNPNSKLEIMGDKKRAVDTLFQVKDNQGNTVFAVFPDGVHIFMSEDALVDPEKSGFIVNGRNTSNVISEYFRVTPDSVRIYINDDDKRSRRGSFSVGKRKSRRSNLFDDFLHITPDSTRIYVSGEVNAGFNVIDDNVNTPLFRLHSINYFLGHYAGETTVPQIITPGITKGTHNIFFGYSAGKANINGGGSVLIGKDAGLNSTGSATIALGADAGVSNTTGIGNIFIGHAAGFGATRSGNFYK